MPIIANQIVYYTRLAVLWDPAFKKKDKRSSSTAAQCEKFSIKQTSKMLFTQRVWATH